MNHLTVRREKLAPRGNYSDFQGSFYWHIFYVQEILSKVDCSQHLGQSAAEELSGQRILKLNVDEHSNPRSH